jgi:hypothetical protein
MNETTISQLGLFESTAAPKDSTKETARLSRKTRKQSTTINVRTNKSTSANKPASTAKSGSPASSTDLSRPRSGLVPAGDIRLTANVKEEIHLKLKLVSVHRRTTIGELVEELVEKYLESPYVIKK